jgi:agmatinase
VPFLGTRPHPKPRVALLGVPYDRTQSHRRGAAGGPHAIRTASWSLETYSPTLGRDLEEVALADLGDLEVADLEPAEMVEAVAQWVKALDPSAIPFLLGGDHTITVGAVRALAERWPNLVVVQFDAHADLREAYEKEPLSHACTTRRIWEILGDDRIVQLGVRSYTREEWAFARSHCRWSLGSLALPETVLADLRARPVYLTLDVDVLDPAFAPGVGNPEPGGPAFSDLCAALRALGSLRVVGMDVVEVSPPFDPAQITATAAAKLVRELILQFA